MNRISKKIQHNSLSGDNMRPESHRVLLIDEEPAICFAYSKLLEREQFGFDTCDTVTTAIVLLKKNDYFAVISDVHFSGSNNEEGECLLSVVRKECPQAKVILVTGYASDELKEKALSLGVSNYIEKPVCPTLILGILRHFSDAACAALFIVAIEIF